MGWDRAGRGTPPDGADSPMTATVLALLASYLLGSVPFGFVLGHMKGVDLREHGSGNVGATNAGRVLGRRFGLLVFVLDFAKGWVPALFLARWIADREEVAWSQDGVALLMGAAAIVGHVFPIWLRFKGGKGVATSAGVCAGLHWPAVLAALLIWIAVLKWSRFVSLASMISAAAFPVAFALMVGPDVAFGQRRLVTGLAILLAAVIIALHRSNIARLLRGEELRVGGTVGASSGTDGSVGGHRR